MSTSRRTKTHFDLLFFSCALALTMVSERSAGESPEWIYEHISPSLVTVLASNLNDQSKLTIGSGVVLDGKKVVTNCHVVDGSSVVVVIQHKQSFKVTEITRHSFADICLLNVPKMPFPSIQQFKPVARVKVGQRVYAIGSPSGLELTLSDGLVSGIREMPADRERLPGQMQPIVQTTASIEHGSSGGGLFDETGALVGITTFMLCGGNQNFAIPIDRVTELFQQSPIDNQPARLSADVKRGLSASVAYRTSPRLTFGDPAEEKQWLKEMSKRLADKIPDQVAREGFLVTVQYEAVRAGLDPQLILAMIAVLREFQKYAVGKNGNQGYMQIRLGWKETIGDASQNLFNTRTNLRYGCTILRHFLELENGDMPRALGRYNTDRFLDSDSKVDSTLFADKVLRTWVKTWDYRAKESVQRSNATK